MRNAFEKNRSTKIAIGIIILLVVGYFVFRLIGNWHKRAIDTAIDRQRQVWQTENDALKDKITDLQEILRLQREELVSEQKLFDAFGEDAALIFPDKKINCDVLQRQIKAFYRYLDQKDYIKSYHLENGISGFFNEIKINLSDKPPTVIGETRDLFTLMHNLAHFYRVLGKNRLKLVTEIMKNEADLLESTMAVFYAWSTLEDCPVGDMQPPSLRVLYEYSGFFLNTIAGRSYLFRRDSKVRKLVGYYSVLILDRADAAALNPHGIDIRPFLDSLIYDIRNRKGLLYQRQYLSKLEEIQKRYQP